MGEERRDLQGGGAVGTRRRDLSRHVAGAGQRRPRRARSDRYLVRGVLLGARSAQCRAGGTERRGPGPKGRDRCRRARCVAPPAVRPRKRSAAHGPALGARAVTITLHYGDTAHTPPPLKSDRCQGQERQAIAAAEPNRHTTNLNRGSPSGPSHPQPNPSSNEETSACSACRKCPEQAP